MPRIKRQPEPFAYRGDVDLLAALVNELKEPKDFGQPMIDEEVFAKTNPGRSAHRRDSPSLSPS